MNTNKYNLEKMVIHKLICSLDCDIIDHKVNYIKMSDGCKYSVIKSHNGKVNIKVSLVDYFILLVPKYVNSICLIPSNYDFYLIPYDAIAELIENKQYISNLFHCVNKIIVFDLIALIENGTKF